MPKTINDIIPPSRRKAMQTAQSMEGMSATPPPPTPPVEDDSDDSDTPVPSYPRPLGTMRRGFPWKYAIAALVVLVIGITVLHAFSGARVEVTPVVSAANVSGEFAATMSAGDLPYEIITAEVIASASVPAEGTEESNDAAQGTITVYNAQEKTQQLIKNTRFESPNGLIYRIHDSISVPAGTPSKPGELKVTVYADQGGEKYNIGPASFTIPGLKGSATFDLVYARSADAMAGGFSGIRPSVSSATKQGKYEALKPTLNEQVTSALVAELPEGYVLIPGATWTTYEPQPDGTGTSGTVTLQEKALASAVIFPKEALAKAIAYRALGPSYDGQPVTLTDESTLSLASMSGTAPVAGDQTFSFTLSGSTNILWIVNPEKVASAIAGKSRQSAQTVLTGFPEVARANIVLRPFWAGTYPADPKDIKVLVEGAPTK